MDNKLIEATSKKETGKEILAFLEGFQLSCDILRNNKYYGHYAKDLTVWLERYLKEQVKETSVISG